jgi:hypothetical protein
VYDEIFEKVKTGAASRIVPTLRKVREEWGTSFYSSVSAIERVGHPPHGSCAFCQSLPTALDLRVRGAHPCKVRKDGAPSVVVMSAKKGMVAHPLRPVLRGGEHGPNARVSA